MQSHAAIQSSHLTKQYGTTRAVDEIDLAIPYGECFGLLGHNGAGKTTAIRMLTCRSTPTSGSAHVLGHDVVHERSQIRPRINVVFDEQNLHPRLSGRGTLRFWAKLYGASPERVDELLGLVGLDPGNKTAVKDWSTGMRQRLIIARALINEPEVLFLDEPTRGLDPASALALREIVQSLVDQGTTVFLTTHDMHEADALCHRIAFIAEGRIVAMDTPRALKLSGTDRLEVDITTDTDEQIRLVLDDPDDRLRLKKLTDTGRIRTMHSREPSLADVFVQLAGRSLVETGTA
ncbi:MAG: ABC transporter ATP-binding protein [Gaiellales bacterium]